MDQTWQVIAKVQGEKNLNKYKRRSILWLVLWFGAMGGWTIDHIRLTNHIVTLQNLATNAQNLAKTAQSNAESLFLEARDSQRQSRELLDQVKEWERVAKQALAEAEGRR